MRDSKVHVVDIAASDGDKSALGAYEQGATQYVKGIKDRFKGVPWSTRTILYGLAIALLLVFSGLAGGLGYYFSHRNTTLEANGAKSSSSSSSDNSGLSFERDPRYTRSFWGMDYTSLNAQMDSGCGVTQQDVIEDLKILYQLTPRIRLYGMDCQQGEFVLNGLKMLNIDMGVVLTVWVDNNETTFNRQTQLFWDAVNKHGWDHIIGVSVGNEAIYRKDVTAAQLGQKLGEMRANVTAAGHPEIPVYTTDNTDFPTLLSLPDECLMDNVHPFFAPVPASQGANWTFKYFYDTDQSLASQPKYKKTVAISEIGWPTQPTDQPNLTAVPSIPNLNTLLSAFVCQANAIGLPYFWFEFMDEPWKLAAFNSVREANWGIFDQNRNLKPGVTLPNCPLPPFTIGDVKFPQPPPYLNGAYQINQPVNATGFSKPFTPHTFWGETKHNSSKKTGK